MHRIRYKNTNTEFQSSTAKPPSGQPFASNTFAWNIAMFFDGQLLLLLHSYFNLLSTNFTKWSNTLKQFVAKFPTNCLSVFDHFVGLRLKGLKVVFLLLADSSLMQTKVLRIRKQSLLKQISASFVSSVSKKSKKKSISWCCTKKWSFPSKIF